MKNSRQSYKWHETQPKAHSLNLKEILLLPLTVPVMKKTFSDKSYNLCKYVVCNIGNFVIITSIVQRKDKFILILQNLFNEEVKQLKSKLKMYESEEQQGQGRLFEVQRELAALQNKLSSVEASRNLLEASLKEETSARSQLISQLFTLRKVKCDMYCMEDLLHKEKLLDIVHIQDRFCASRKVTYNVDTRLANIHNPFSVSRKQTKHIMNVSTSPQQLD